MRIAVIDGQGGGIGKHLTDKIRNTLPNNVEIIGLGTNCIATSAMMKAGANEGATGENAIVQTVKNVDIIVGTVAVLAANSMLGEVTPKIAKAIGESRAKKILLPFNKSNIEIIGVANEPLPHLIEFLVKRLENIMEDDKNV
ncbi:DUF3842 family protein [Desulfitibacter alkalitolerans]|uniref:DUF3842 family protein n=1 Tax=Desulfitibacter alkalitolerans TaxID=264641 RepID=UPI0004895CB7|nr:DUF3842 family protein [Desulfitibacter alkalitolerans]